VELAKRVKQSMLQRGSEAVPTTTLIIQCLARERDRFSARILCDCHARYCWRIQKC
jgi:hypothetical protein